ncbi:class C beta-lactamase-related serine hydrolase [Puteibacter caeruleilacunae]|nr:class C beta-lactamase-related serine hydrolase [Puteibacter caeruleilacunae]
MSYIFNFIFLYFYVHQFESLLKNHKPEATSNRYIDKEERAMKKGIILAALLLCIALALQMGNVFSLGAFFRSLINKERAIEHPTPAPLESKKFEESEFYKHIKSLDDKEVKLVHPTPAERLRYANRYLKQRSIIEGSITLLNNQDSLIPFRQLDTLNIACITIGTDSLTHFHKRLRKYTTVDNYFLNDTNITATIQSLKNYNLIIAGVYGNSDKQLAALKEIPNVIYSVFENPLNLNNGHFHNMHTIHAFINDSLAQQATAELLFGAIPAKGVLPIDLDEFNEGYGEKTQALGRFNYTIPEAVNINGELLNQKIDSLALLGINKKAYPGCQVLVAKDGKVIFHKSYGHTTYDKQASVGEEMLYDWASVTKITGPLPAIMKLYDNKRLNLDIPFSSYWKRFKNTNKEKLTLRQILAHQAGLYPWIPFWELSVRKNNKFKSRFVGSKQSRKHTEIISDSLWLNKRFKTKIFKSIEKSKLDRRFKYKYSGLCFFLFPDMISELTGMDYEYYIKQSFFKPLGAKTVTYNPLRFHNRSQIIPTEYDSIFRHQLIHGTVHDEGAAAMGGVSGNAGLFGTTNDLAKIMQMYLQMGTYGGKEYLSEETMKLFTKIQYPDNDNRRGLGFDKPYIDNQENDLDDAYPAPSCSPNSFGHSGFTGTFAWADPDKKVLFIFMSNRVYPTRDNKKIYDLNLRPQFHQAIYDCLNTVPQKN